MGEGRDIAYASLYLCSPFRKMDKLAGVNRARRWCSGTRIEQQATQNYGTELDCCAEARPNMAFEQDFPKATSRKTLSYTLNKGRLILTNDEGIHLEFKKID
jgi:hypothetical protein